MRSDTASITVAAALVLTFAAGCGDDDDDGGAGGEDVNVVLSEFIVEPDPSSASAGEITFVADNQGGETHEFVVVRADAADALPVDEDGAFDEATFGEDNILGEIEDVGSGDTAELTLDVEQGTYVLLCNIVEEEEGGERESHFAEGMHTTFVVE
jgi:hypothetical protein